MAEIFWACRHGQGRLEYADGDVYDGAWRDGKPLVGIQIGAPAPINKYFEDFGKNMGKKT